jgi:hypothetical protein
MTALWERFQHQEHLPKERNREAIQIQILVGENVLLIEHQSEKSLRSRCRSRCRIRRILPTQNPEAPKKISPPLHFGKGGENRIRLIKKSGSFNREAPSPVGLGVRSYRFLCFAGLLSS